MKRPLIFSIVLAIFLFSHVSAGETNEAKTVLKNIERELMIIFETLDLQLAAAARDLSSVNLDSPEARKILNNLAQVNKNIIDTSIIDLKGKMLLVEPQDFKKYEGSDLSMQEVVVRLRKEKKPIFSEVFPSVEGVNAVVFEYPIFSKEDKLIGSLSMLLKPEGILEDAIAPVTKGTNVHAWAMQRDGLVLYDQDKSQIAKNVFTGEIYKPYPNLISFCKIVAKDKSGSGSYRFILKGFDQPVKKNAVWSSVYMHGLKWRIIAYTIEKKDNS